jgi:hypothetical protein
MGVSTSGLVSLNNNLTLEEVYEGYSVALKAWNDGNVLSSRL